MNRRYFLAGGLLALGLALPARAQSLPPDPFPEATATTFDRLSWAQGSGPGANPQPPSKNAPAAEAPAKTQPPAQAPVMAGPTPEIHNHYHYYTSAPAQAPVFAQPQATQAPVYQQAVQTGTQTVTTTGPSTQVVVPPGLIRTAIGGFGTAIKNTGARIETVKHNRIRLVPGQTVTTSQPVIFASQTLAAPMPAQMPAPVFAPAPLPPAVPSAQH